MEVKEDFELFKKTTKTTGTFAGVELHLWQLFPYYDARVPPPAEPAPPEEGEEPEPPGWDYTIEREEVVKDEQWLEVRPFVRRCGC